MLNRISHVVFFSFYVNVYVESNFTWLANGNAEQGPCQSSTGVTPPTGWIYSGMMTQMAYDFNVTYTMSNPGPR